MIEDRLIICIASNWDLDPTSKHHLMRHLSRRNDIVWVNYHGSRKPKFSGKDARAIVSALKRVAAGAKPINDRMVQLTPFVLPGAPSKTRGAINAALLKSRIRRIVAQRRRSPDQPVQLWTFAPDVAHLVGAFGEECVVYYCVDEFSQFEGFDKDAIAAAEDRLIRSSDIVITTSQKLHDARCHRHDNLHLVRHGVDHAHFAKAATDPLPLPEPLRGIPKPIAGFIGLVHHWFDVQLMREVAKRLADVSFVIVGDEQIDTSELRRLPNVHFVGRRPYETLPAYCAAFDIGLIPFVRSSMTENVNPIKLREYLAAGLPVVSTGLPEVRSLEPDVRCADDAERFAAACREAIDESSPESRGARSASVADQSWEGVTHRVSQLVAAAAATRSQPAHALNRQCPSAHRPVAVS